MTTIILAFGLAFDDKPLIWFRMRIDIVSRVYASMSQGDWPGSRGYPGKLNRMNGFGKSNTIKDANSQVIYNFVLKFREPITVQSKKGFLCESRESRIRLYD